MIGNLINPLIPDYPNPEGNLPFSEYINKCREIIQKRRIDLTRNPNANKILNANSPFELKPESQAKFGALLIHGLLDCPFSLRDIGLRLQTQGVLCRSILLPGHGTISSDLMHVTYQDWIKAVRYGVRSLQQEVSTIFLIGYSTGAALSLYHALNDANIAGIILLAPAIKIKAPVDIAFSWQELLKLCKQDQPWIYLSKEVDYAKYKSICFNGVRQVAELTKAINELKQQCTLHCPLFMAVSSEDETVSGQSAIDLFLDLPNPHNQLLLYTSLKLAYPDKRIIVRETFYPDSINHFSHVSIPFAPDNPHYGEQGDYLFASRLQKKDGTLYGAYNRIKMNSFELLFKLGLTRQRRRELTFNPDFEFMMSSISQFIDRNGSTHSELKSFLDAGRGK